MDGHPATPGQRSIARVATPNARSYLVRLCKHFQHKCPVIQEEHSGRITFTIGDCQVDTTEGLMTLSLTAADAAQMEQLQDVVARHLVRFAFREDLQIHWQAA